MVAFDAHKNLATGTIATVPSPANSGTTMTLASGQGARCPATPFNMTVWQTGVPPNPTNSEIVRITGLSGDAVTSMVRQQEGTSARTITTGDSFAVAATAKTFTDIENAVMAIINGAWVSVKDKAYGALGNASNNDRPAFTNATNDVSAAGGGVVFGPTGTYNFDGTSVVVPSNVLYIGMGPGATIVQKTSANVPCFKFTSGADGSHISRSGMQNMQVNGNTLAGSVVDLFHADTLFFDNCTFNFSAGVAVDVVDLFDSYFSRISMRNNGSTTERTLRIRSSGASSGYAMSTQATNMLWFKQMIIETFILGAIDISRGDATGSSPNGFYFDECKFETFETNGDPVLIDSITTDVHFSKVFLAVTGFNGGYSTAVNGINSSAGGDSSFRDITLTTGGSLVTGRSTLKIGSTTGIQTVDNVWFDGLPTAGVVDFGSGGGRVDIGAVGGSTGATPFAGTHPENKTLTYNATLNPGAMTAHKMTVRVALTGNVTSVTVPTFVQTGDRIAFEFTQDVTAGRTVTFGSGWRYNWTPTTTNGKVNRIEFEYDGTQFTQCAAVVGI